MIDARLFSAKSTAFGDYDNDGWPDIFLPESEWSNLNKKRILLLHNEGNGRFSDRTAAILEKVAPQRAKGGGAIFGDYDNDGDLDLYVPIGIYQSSERARDVLLRNDRGVFRDVAMEAGLTDELPSDNAIWLDYNRDGWLDLYVGHVVCSPPDPEARNKLYRNNGDGSFTDVTKEVGLDIQLKTQQDWPHCAGGSNGGLAAGDVNNDGWPDLYVGVWSDRNRLFLNDGRGKFRDVTDEQIADPGQAFGVAVGDIENDGDLDIFQAAGGMGMVFRSLLLLNLGEGQFLDATEGLGLIGLGATQALGVGLGDIDNDGDLDLLIANPGLLYLNNGDGTFTDRTSQSGIADVALTVSFGEYDLDGFLDVMFGSDSTQERPGRLYRNNGNSNHYLRVECVGTKSNRSGIGTRLIATSGDLRQMREILGGLGFYQDELVAHFGLGERTRVDRLEVRWPSGRVEVLTDIPADQKIRVIEGQDRYHVVTPTVWEHPPRYGRGGLDTSLPGDRPPGPL